jgi:membrane-associated phospholipid phosphatase
MTTQQSHSLSMKTRLLMAALLVAADFLYLLLNQTLTGGIRFAIPLDRLVPIWPLWVIPYVLIIPLWAICFIWMIFKMEDQLYRACVTAGLFTFISAAVFWLLVPNYIDRPALANTSWTTAFLNFIYANDRPYNAFPSAHVYTTTLFCFFFSQMYPRYRWLWISITGIVMLSTVLTHQHYLLDVLGGFLLAWLGFRVGMYFYPPEPQVEHKIEYDQGLM